MHWSEYFVIFLCNFNFSFKIIIFGDKYNLKATV